MLINTTRFLQCIIQWTYVAGNNWGICEDGTSGNGCGPQETFRGCSDIAITPNPILSSLIGSDYQVKIGFKLFIQIEVIDFQHTSTGFELE